MARPVDEKIVKMRIDNQDFKTKADETLGILGRIKQSFGGKNVDVGGMNHLENSVDRIAGRFSNLGIIGITALQNITNKAMDAGSKIVKAMTIAPVTEGFQEYELKLNSVQTIMAGTGEDLKTVNKYLEDLNTYSDKTIYSFADMTQNIGKFTNAGVDLDTSVKAIMGISNAAALSGANSNEASRAMYNFSQALSKGYVQLIDWKSIENANMATKGFKEELIKTAVELGTVTEAGNGMYMTLDGNLFNATQNFNEVLQDQWMTSDALTTTLAKYSDETTKIGKASFAAAQDIKTFSQLMQTSKEALASGWSQSWEIIIGDFEEAKEFWTNVSKPIIDFIDNMSKSRNEMLRQFKDAGGFKNIITGLSNVFSTIGKVLGTVGKAFRSVFPKQSVDGVVKITEHFANFTERMKLTDGVLEAVSDTFEWFFGLIKDGFGILGAFGNAVKNLIPDNLGERFGKIFSGISIKLGKLKTDFSVIDFIKERIEDLGVAFEWVGDKVEDFLDYLGNMFSPKMKKVEESLSGFASVTAFKSPFQPKDLNLMERATTIFEKLSDAFDRFKEGFKKGWGKLTDFLGSIGLTDVMGAGFLGGSVIVLTKFVQFMSSLSGFFDQSEKWTKIFGDFTKDIGDSLKTFTSQVKYNNLMKIAGSLLGIAAAIKIMEGIDVKDVAKSIGAFAISLGLMVGAMKLISTIKFTDFSGGKTFMALIGMATAVTIIASAMVKLGELDTEGVLKASVAIGYIGVVLTGMMMALSNVSAATKGQAEMGKILLAMAGISLVFMIVTRSISKLSKIPGDKLLNGVLAVTTIMTILVGAFVLMGKVKLPSLKDMQAFTKFTSGLATSAIAIAIFAVSLRILVEAIEDIGSINMGVLTQGLIGLTVILGAFAVYQRVSEGLGSLSAGLGIAAMAAALIILLHPLRELGNMNPKVLSQGIAAISVSLFALGMAMLAAKNGFTGAAGIAVAVGALLLLYPVVKLYGEMPLPTLAKGLITIAGALAILVVAVSAMKTAIVGVGALVVAAAALNLLVVPIAALGALGIKGVLAGLVGLAGGLALLTVGILALAAGSVALAPAVPAMLALGVALAVIGGSVLLAGAGLSILATGVAALAAIAVMSATSIIAAFDLMLTAIIDLRPKFEEVIFGFFDSILNVMIRLAPKVGEVGPILIIALLTGILKYIPRITELGGLIIVALLVGLGSKMGDVALAAVGLITTFFTSIATAMETERPKLIKSILSILEEITLLVVQASIALLDALVGGIPGVTEKLEKASEKASAAIKEHFAGNTLGEELIGDTTEGIEKGIKQNEPTYRKNGREIMRAHELGILESDMKGVTDKKTDELAVGLGGPKVMGLLNRLGINIGEAPLDGFGTTDFFGAGEDGSNELAAGMVSPEMMAMFEENGIDVKDAFGEGFESNSKKKSGEKAAEEVADGIESKSGRVANEAKELAKEANSAIKSVGTYGAGTAFGQGFINGMTAMQRNIKAAATSLGNMANKTLKRSIESRSPSKVTTKLGEFFGEGFVVGIKDKSRSVSSAAAEMATSAITSMNDFISTFAEDFIPKEEEAYEFKLKPILDLDGMDEITDRSIGIRPDTSRTTMLLDGAERSFSQNGDKNIQQPVNNSNVVNHNYEISVNASGEVPTDKLKQMAITIQAEIKRLNDKDRMSRGEAVYY